MAKEYRVKTLKNGEKRYVFDVSLETRADGTRIRTTVNAKSVKEGSKKVTDNDSMLFKDAYALFVQDCKNRDYSPTVWRTLKWYIQKNTRCLKW